MILKKDNKKAQILDQLGTMVVSLIGVAIVIGVGMVILVNILSQTNTISPDGTCCANKTEFYNSTLVKCCDYDCNGTHCSTTGDAKVANGTNITAANCTVGATNNEFTAACNSTIDVINAADDIPGWLSIIVIVIIGAILISLISIFRRQ